MNSNPTVSSSEVKIINKQNKLDEIDQMLLNEDDGARTGKNEPNLANFDIGLENDIGLLKLGSLQNSGLDSINVLPLNDIQEADDDVSMDLAVNQVKSVDPPVLVEKTAAPTESKTVGIKTIFK